MLIWSYLAGGKYGQDGDGDQPRTQFRRTREMLGKGVVWFASFLVWHCTLESLIDFDRWRTGVGLFQDDAHPSIQVTNRFLASFSHVAGTRVLKRWCRADWIS